MRAQRKACRFDVLEVRRAIDCRFGPMLFTISNRTASTSARMSSNFQNPRVAVILSACARPTCGAFQGDATVLF